MPVLRAGAHYIATCPVWPARLFQVSHPGRLLWACKSFSFLLVDSGTEDLFIDERIAREVGLSLVELSEHKSILYLGRTHARAGSVEHGLCNSAGHRKHHEPIQCFLIPSSLAPAVLWFPWLPCHNPQIDWPSGSVMGRSFACDNCCLCCCTHPFCPRLPELLQ